MNRRSSTILFVMLATLVVACVDLSAPNGAASISALQLPSLFVVRGDVMRDSTGAPGKPQVIPYDGSGNPIPDLQAEYFILDSAPAAHFGSDGVLAGDKLGSVRLVGQIGNLQTPAVQVFVTVEPTKIAPASPRIDTIRAPIGKDSASSLGKGPITLLVTGVGDTAVQGVLAHLTLTKTLESSSSTQPAVYIIDGNGKPASADSVGYPLNSSKTVVVLTRNLADQALLSGTKIDSVIVEASASYKGVPLKGSPVRLVFPVRVTF